MWTCAGCKAEELSLEDAVPPWGWMEAPGNPADVGYCNVCRESYEVADVDPSDGDSQADPGDDLSSWFE